MPRTPPKIDQYQPPSQQPPGSTENLRLKTTCDGLASAKNHALNQDFLNTKKNWAGSYVANQMDRAAEENYVLYPNRESMTDTDEYSIERESMFGTDLTVNQTVSAPVSPKRGGHAARGSIDYLYSAHDSRRPAVEVDVIATKRKALWFKVFGSLGLLIGSSGVVTSYLGLLGLVTAWTPFGWFCVSVAVLSFALSLFGRADDVLESVKERRWERDSF